MRSPLPRVHAFTDERVARRPGLAQLAAELASGGGPDLALHARGRELTGREHYDLAARLRAATSPAGATSPPARLFVNDRLDVALATAADGVQLRRGSLAPADARRMNPEWWIGVSVHDLDEAWAARTEGADYLVVGPAYATATHPDRTPVTRDGLAEIARMGLPVIGIGGITADRIPELRAVGVYGVAAIRALWDAPDPRAAAQAFAGQFGT